jgi:hypothetical protein
MDDYDKYYEKYLKYKNKYLELKQDGGMFESATKTISSYLSSTKTKNKNKPDMPDTTPFILILGNDTILSSENFETDKNTKFTLEEIHKKLDYNVCEEKRNLSYIITHLGQLLEFCYNRKNFNCGKKPSSISFNQYSNYLDDYKELEKEEEDTKKKEEELAAAKKEWQKSTDYISKDQKQRNKYDDDQTKTFKTDYDDRQLKDVIPKREETRIDNREQKIKANENIIDEDKIDIFTRDPSFVVRIKPSGAGTKQAQDKINQADANRIKFNSFRFAHIVLNNRIILKDTTNPKALQLLSSDKLIVTIKRLTEIINNYIKKFHETCNLINTYAVIKYDSQLSGYSFVEKPTPIT